jgi:hypothetical protein
VSSSAFVNDVEVSVRFGGLSFRSDIVTGTGRLQIVLDPSGNPVEGVNGVYPHKPARKRSCAAPSDAVPLSIDCRRIRPA